MSDCCTTSCETTVSPAPKTYTCPLNHKKYRQVPVKTVLHNIIQPWNQEKEKQDYYFCDDPDCDVVYFALDDNVICTHELRSTIGIKCKTADSTLCYCFGITFEQALVNPGLKQYVIEKTAQQMCECATRNPSGKCCLKDFP